MAYWLYCQSCKQWSKSATPLSDEKSCPSCSMQYTAIQPIIMEKPQKLEIEKPMHEKDVNELASTDTLEDLEASKTLEYQGMPGASESSKVSDKTESLEITEAKDIEGQELLQTVETLETTTSQKTATADMQDDSEISGPDNIDNTEKQENYDSDELEKELDLNETSAVETLETVDTATISNLPKMTRVHETFLETKRRSKNNHS